MPPVLEPGRDTKIATAADRPEQIRVSLGIRVKELAIGCHNVGSQQICQTVLAGEVADSTIQCSPPIPTEPVSPNLVARPWAPAVKPISAQAVRPSTSICKSSISESSSTIP